MSKFNDVKNDIVLTPSYFADFMCQLVEVQHGDFVLDNAAGAGALLRSANKYGAYGIGVEYDGEMYQTLEKNLEYLIPSSVSLHVGDGLKLDELSLSEYNKVVINPPYSFDGSGLIFGYEAAKNMKTGKMIILCPSSAGSKEEWTSKLLENNTLKASITCADIFKGYASVNVSLYVFECGRPHEEDDEVVFIDFKEDGYTRSGRKKQKGKVTDSDKAKEKYQEVLDIVLKDKEPELLKDKVIKDTLKENKNWEYRAHVVIDTTPTEEDFKKTVAEYLAFKIKRQLDEAVKSSTEEE